MTPFQCSEMDKRQNTDDNLGKTKVQIGLCTVMANDFFGLLSSAEKGQNFQNWGKKNGTKDRSHRPIALLWFPRYKGQHYNCYPVYEQLETYLDEKKLLCKFQSRFRGCFSTDTCLIHLTDFIKFQIDKGHLVGMVLLDLQKAFDTVYGILLMKIEALCLSQDVTRSFDSYLSDHRQLVDVAGVLSSSTTISCGVQQGSILGPLLFLIYS